MGYVYAQRFFADVGFGMQYHKKTCPLRSVFIIKSLNFGDKTCVAD